VISSSVRQGLNASASKSEDSPRDGPYSSEKYAAGGVKTLTAFDMIKKLNNVRFDDIFRDSTVSFGSASASGHQSSGPSSNHRMMTTSASPMVTPFSNKSSKSYYGDMPVTSESLDEDGCGVNKATEDEESADSARLSASEHDRKEQRELEDGFSGTGAIAVPVPTKANNKARNLAVNDKTANTTGDMLNDGTRAPSRVRDTHTAKQTATKGFQYVIAPAVTAQRRQESFPHSQLESRHQQQSQLPSAPSTNIHQERTEFGVVFDI
jgi:hypothetical protein